LLRQYVRSAALAVTALTAVFATPHAGALARSATQPQIAQAHQVAAVQAMPAPMSGVAASERLDGSWTARLQDTSQQLTAEQQRKQAEAAAKAEADAKAKAAAEAAAAAQQAAPKPAVAAAPAIPSYSPGSIQQIIVDAFSPLGGTAVQWGLRVAKCESGYNPQARNPSGASGLFQFMPSTFANTPPGRAGGSIWDPVANSQAAAWMYSQGRQGEWSCK
jgi:soluble lytic murein transglycosylase-like protein